MKDEKQGQPDLQHQLDLSRSFGAKMAEEVVTLKAQLAAKRGRGRSGCPRCGKKTNWRKEHWVPRTSRLCR
jgi:transposase